MDKPGFMGRTLLWRPLVPGWSQGGNCSWNWDLERREVTEGTFLASDGHHGVSWHGFGNLFLEDLGQQESGTENPAQQIPAKSSGSSQFWDKGDADGLPVSLVWKCSPSSSSSSSPVAVSFLWKNPMDWMGIAWEGILMGRKFPAQLCPSGESIPKLRLQGFGRFQAWIPGPEFGILLLLHGESSSFF